MSWHSRSVLALVLFLGGQVSAFREVREAYDIQRSAAFKAKEPPIAQPVDGGDQKNVFELKYEDALRLDFLRRWTLKEASDRSCSGESKCGASIQPVIDRLKPTELSKAHISVFPNCDERGKSLALCPLILNNISTHDHQHGDGRDLRAAIVEIPERTLSLKFLETALPSRFKRYIISGMENPRSNDITLKVLWILFLLTCIAVACVQLSLIWTLFRVFLEEQPLPSAPKMETDPKLEIPSLVRIMKDGLIDAVSLIYGCILLLLATYSFLIKFGRRDSTVFLLFPPIFGPVALLRIFLSTSRRQLYHTLFRRGVLIDFRKSASQSYDLLALLTYLGLLGIVVALISEAVHLWSERDVVWTKLTTGFVMAQLVLWVSPFYYTISSIVDAIRLETDAMRGLSVLRVQESFDGKSAEDGPSEEKSMDISTSHQLAYVSEQDFCSAARAGEDLQKLVQRLAAGEKPSFPASKKPFSLCDMYWVTPFVGQTIGGRSGRTLVAAFQPLLWLGIFTLGLTSIIICIKHQCQVPKLKTLDLSFGRLEPPFESEIKGYTVFLWKERTAFSVSAEIDLQEATNLKLHNHDAQEQEMRADSDHIVGPVPVRDIYPVYLNVTASTADDKSTYWLRVLTMTIVTKTIMLRGRTVGGHEYSRCILGASLKDHIFSLPKDLVSLDADVSVAPMVFGIPVAEGLPREFSTVYMAKPEKGCEFYCAESLSCMAWMVAKVRGPRAACAFIMAPTDLTCQELHGTRSANDVAAGDFRSKVCIHEEVTSKQTGSTAKRSCEIKRNMTLDINRSFSVKGLVKHNSDHADRLISSMSWKIEALVHDSAFELEDYDLTFAFDVPALLLRAKVMQGKVPVDVTVEKAGHLGRDFQVKLAYNPLHIPSKTFTLLLELVSPDSDFGILYRGPSNRGVGNVSDAHAFTVRIDKWNPKKKLLAWIKPREIHLFNESTVNIHIMTPEDLTPLQTLIRQNCSVPVCRGKLDECRRQGNGSFAKYVDLASFGTTLRQGKVKNQFQASLAEARFGKEFFTPKVVRDIAAHCSYESGLLSIVQQTFTDHVQSVVSHTPKSVRQRYYLLQQLSHNPEFQENNTWTSNPILNFVLKDAGKHALSDWAPLADVVLSWHSLYKLTYASCEASEKGAIGPHIFRSVLERITQAAIWKTWQPDDEMKIRTALKMLVRCAKEKNISLYPAPVRGRNIALFEMVWDEETFRDLLPIWDLISPPEWQAGTILHVAAQNGWARSITLTLEAWEHTSSSIPHGIDAPREFLVTSREHDEEDEDELVSITISNQTALHVACEAQCPLCVEKLLERSANVSAEMQALQQWFSRPASSSSDDLTFAHRMDAGWSQAPPSLSTPNTTPASDDLAKFSGSDVSTRHVEILGVKPLHLALAYKCEKCVQALLDKGADHDAEMSIKASTSKQAVQGGTSELAAAVQSGSRHGCILRPLDLAVLKCPECVLLLQGRGASGLFFSPEDTNLTVDEVYGKLLHECEIDSHRNWWEPWLKDLSTA